MKRLKLYLLLLLAPFFPSCEKYMEVELNNQISIDEVFDKRSTTEAYLAQVYGFLPDEGYPLGNEGSGIPRSDEATFSWPNLDYTPMNNGTYGTDYWAYQVWADYYKGIAQATIFMNNVHRCTELSTEQKDIMHAEARFIRAYMYSLLLRRYGPVFIWGDQDPDQAIKPETIDRHSLDQNVEFILSEWEKAIAVLPLEIESPQWKGRITKGAAMAAKSRLTLYMARPLFNGCELYKGMKNMYGDFLFPQSEDPAKWDVAAKAAKDVIDLNLYALYEDTEENDQFRKYIKSYMGVMFKNWNSEVIWGRWSSAWDWQVRCAPPRVVKEGYGGFCPSLKLVDTYPMAESGRYPVTGYEANGNPIIDPKSGYQETGFTSPYRHPLDTFVTINAHNSCVGRDARFYASVLANGMYWINTFKGQKLVTFYDGGTSSYQSSGDVVKVGYLWRRMNNPENNIEENRWGEFCFPTYRLAEIYLNYAEACNEKTSRDEAEALRYINKVRNRVGLNNLEVAYPEVKGNKLLLRELILKERMVELAFEGHRFHDIRTWMIAPKEFNGPYYTRNVLSKTYEGSWTRTDQIFNYEMVFENKHYFQPIHDNQRKDMVNMTQNYGW